MGMSRSEDILQAIIDGTDSSVLSSPQSRAEYLLIRVLDKINEMSGGGGGGGGLSFHICSSNEYDYITGVPTVSNPSSTTFYLVPAVNSEHDAYDEWVYVDNRWERFASGSHISNLLSELGDVDIQTLKNGQTLVYDSVLRKWKNEDYIGGKTYTFSEGEVDGAFLVESDDGTQQTVTVHGLLPFCFVNSEDKEVIYDSGSIDDD